MTKINNALLGFLLACLAGLIGCNTDKNNDNPPDPPVGYGQGIFVINEGPFQSGTGTITFLSVDATGVTHKIFQGANDGKVLGNIAQSMNLETNNKTDAYIAVNNASKIEVVNISTFENIQTIENINTPRFIEFGGNDKVYISSWDNTVKVLSTVGYEFFGQIDVGTGPERMLKVGNTIWVLNQGGFSIDSTISIINTDTDQVIQTLQVYPKPTGIQQDENGLIWVICSGIGWNGFPGSDDSEGHLLCIDPQDFGIIKDIVFPASDKHPEKLVINKEGDRLFYNYVDGVYRFDIHNNELEYSPFIPRTVMFYGLGLDKKTNSLYASDAVDFVQNGWVYRYDANSGNLTDSIQAGIAPGDFYFTQ